jgi:hypothetical protein
MSEERHDSFANDTKADKGVHAAQVAKPKGSLTASLCLTNTRRQPAGGLSTHRNPSTLSAWERSPISVVNSAMPLPLRPTCNIVVG